MSVIHPPKAPSDHLRLQSFQILSRLRLVLGFRPWLEHTRYHIHRKHHTPLELLWDCFSFGAPLGTLLNLLGSPSPSNLVAHVEDFDFNIGIDEREMHFASFIQRVQFLEVQGRLPYGEVLRPADFLSSTNTAFAKVLRTVDRVLLALQESYPGLFAVPHDSHINRHGLVQDLLESERTHAAMLKTITDAAMSLSENLLVMEPCLECFVVNRARLLQYHDDLLSSIQEIVENGASEKWNQIFRLDEGTTREKVFGAYRSICINYLSLMNFLDKTPVQPALANDANVLRECISPFLSQISHYCVDLQAILDITPPTDNQLYNSLCEAIFTLCNISETMSEVGRQIRTMWCVRSLRDRVYIWTAADPDDLGVVLLDDNVLVDSATDIRYTVCLFEALLLCCYDGVNNRKAEGLVPQYPTQAWEMGPALRLETPLDIVHAISTDYLEEVRCPNADTIEIDWVDEYDVFCTLQLCDLTEPQCEQWISALQAFVPPIVRPSSIPRVIIGQDDASLSEDEDDDGRRITHARSWSVIARKEPHSESSSLMNEEPSGRNYDLPPSYNIPHPLIDNSSDIFPGLPPSNMMRTGLSDNIPPTPPPNLESSPDSDGDPSTLVDLTGKIARDGRYPSAHGGFSDVWKGVWHDGACERNVAVKVLRSGMGDPEVEEKMKRRLQRELHVWKNLYHPHVLELYGTATDFGHYSSMVCPWMDNGSISRYMEKCGDIISMTDRLKLLCEVADGLAYLHSCSIVHGDLTGSNILITDDGKACLCDFGLSSIVSSIVAEFQGTSCFTSTIGGAVRWADAQLYRIHNDDGDIPVVGTPSDIYSFGSVMLEVLSGRIPYHYVRTDAQVIIELHNGKKPRRPAHSFVTDGQWCFIQSCWGDDPNDRPDIQQVCRSVEALYNASLKLHQM